MWLKKITKKKTQSILILLIIMLCSMLMTSSITIMTSWSRPYQTLTRETNAADARVYTRTGNYDFVLQMQERFLALDEVEEARVIQIFYGGENLNVDGRSVDGFFDFSIYDEYQNAKERMIEGKVDHLAADECAIPAVIANTKEIQLGNVITIRDTEYKVAGIYTDPYNMSVSFDTEIIVSELPEGVDSVYYISLFAKDGYDGYDISDAYRENNDGLLEGYMIYQDARISNNQLTEQIFGAILLVMSILILLVSGLMISYLIKNTMISEKNTIATLKTIGYTGKKVSAIYMKMYLALVITGSILGVLFSSIVSDNFTKATYKNLGITHTNGLLFSGAICVTVITLYVLLQVLLVLNKSIRIRPVEVFRGDRTNKKKKISGRAENFSPFAMAWRMIRREKKNTIIIIVTCIMAGYCLNFGATAIDLISGMANQNYYWIGFDKHDVSVEGAGEPDLYSVKAELESLPEVEKTIMSTTNVYISLEWQKGIGDTTISSMVYETFEDLDMRCTSGRNPRYSNEIAIGNAVADKLHKKPGDYMDLYISGATKVTLLISGTYQSFFNMGNSCRMLSSTVEEAGYQINYEYGSVYLNDGVAVDEFVGKYADQFSSRIRMYDRVNKYENILNMITGPQMTALKPFVALVLLISSLNIVAIIYLKNRDNRKTLSIYKAIGYSSGHLLRANLYYIGMIAAISIMITVPAFIFMFPKIMVFAMSFFGFREYPVQYKMATIVWSNIFLFSLFLMSSIISSVNLRHNPVSDLTTD